MEYTKTQFEYDAKNSIPALKHNIKGPPSSNQRLIDILEYVLKNSKLI
jgi:hypothetical protein